MASLVILHLMVAKRAVLAAARRYRDGLMVPAMAKGTWRRRCIVQVDDVVIVRDIVVTLRVRVDAMSAVGRRAVE